MVLYFTSKFFVSCIHTRVPCFYMDSKKQLSDMYSTNCELNFIIYSSTVWKALHVKSNPARFQCSKDIAMGVFRSKWLEGAEGAAKCEPLPRRRGVKGPACGTLVGSRDNASVGTTERSTQKLWGIYKLVGIRVKQYLLMALSGFLPDHRNHDLTIFIKALLGLKARPFDDAEWFWVWRIDYVRVCIGIWNIHFTQLSCRK